MKCPHCTHALTEAEIRTLWSQLSLSKRTRAGKQPTCHCGTCKTCRKREAVRRYRAKRKALRG